MCAAYLNFLSLIRILRGAQDNLINQKLNLLSSGCRSITMPPGYFVSLSALDYQQEKDTKTGSQVRTGLTACPRTQPYKPHENTTVQTTREHNRTNHTQICRLREQSSRNFGLLHESFNRVGDKFSERISATSEIHREEEMCIPFETGILEMRFCFVLACAHVNLLLPTNI